MGSGVVSVEFVRASTCHTWTNVYLPGVSALMVTLPSELSAGAFSQEEFVIWGTGATVVEGLSPIARSDKSGGTRPWLP